MFGHSQRIKGKFLKSKKAKNFLVSYEYFHTFFIWSIWTSIQNLMSLKALAAKNVWPPLDGVKKVLTIICEKMRKKLSLLNWSCSGILWSLNHKTNSAKLILSQIAIFRENNIRQNIPRFSLETLGKNPSDFCIPYQNKYLWFTKSRLNW